MKSDLPPGKKVFLTIIKKIYIQAGAGRKQNALSRGLDNKLQRIVNEVLTIIHFNGYATFSRTGGNEKIWHPIPQKREIVLDIYRNPFTSADLAYNQAGEIKT